jgi:putative NADH-flavin reductase
MKITVLGANGGIGRHLVTHALDDGHEVTAAVRDRRQLVVRHTNLRVVRANALDAVSLARVVDGADAVLSAIGPAKRVDPLRPASTSVRAAVEAMGWTGVQRILVVSAAPLNRSGAGQPWFVRRVVMPVLWGAFPDVYFDLGVMERVLRDSELDWTAVRPPRLTYAAGKGTYRHAVESAPAGSRMTREDVARAMVDFVTVPETFRHAVGISN